MQSSPVSPDRGHSAWMIAERVMRLFLAVAVGALVARHLGPADFGRMSYAANVALILMPVAGLGIKAQIVKWTIREPDGVGEILWTALILRLGASLVIIAIMMMLVRVLPLEEGTLIAIAVFALVPQSYTVLESYFLAHNKGRLIFVSSAFALAVSNSARLAAIYCDADVSVFAALLVAEDVLMLCADAVLFALLRGRPGLRRGSFALARRMVGETYPLIFVHLAGQVYMSGALLLMQALTSNFELGLFAAASRVTAACFALQQTYIASIYPRIVRASDPTESTARPEMVALIEAATMSALAAAIAVSLLSVQIGQILFGPGFAGVAAVISIQIWSSVFSAWRQISGAWMQADGAMWASLRRGVFGVVVLLVAGLVAIPHYGAVGAALAALAGQFAMGFLGDFLGPQTRKHTRAKIDALRFRQTRNLLTRSFRRSAG